MIKEKVGHENRTDAWCIYEDVKVGIPYVMAVDPAEGAQNPDEAADMCAAIVMRPSDKDSRPVIVATLRSTLETIPFAWCCARGARYYNNALLAAETRRGAVNATFAAEMRDWRWWLKMVQTNDVTQRDKQHIGFDTNSKTREMIFEYITEWIGSFNEDEYPMIPDEGLLHELAACVVGKNGRPDHTRDGTLDSTICFGILLWVFRNAADQIRYNGPAVEEKKPFYKLIGMLKASEPVRPVALGQHIKKLR